MADTKVSDFPKLDETNIALTDLATIRDISAGLNKEIEWQDVFEWMRRTQSLPRTKRLTADHSISSTTGTEVTDLTMALEAGTYTVDYYLIVQSATTSVSPMLGINFDGTAAVKSFMYMFADAGTSLLAELYTMDDEGVNTAGFIAGRATRTYSTTAPNLGSTATLAVSTVDVDIPIRITGLLIVTVAGNLELWHSSETATATRVETGSSLVVVRTA